nr:MAG TPA: hypothetical protein [Caudoviricetes sp.]
MKVIMNVLMVETMLKARRYFHLYAIILKG